jgi:hypothetical protein
MVRAEGRRGMIGTRSTVIVCLDEYILETTSSNVSKSFGGRHWVVLVVVVEPSRKRLALSWRDIPANAAGVSMGPAY